MASTRALFPVEIVVATVVPIGEGCEVIVRRGGAEQRLRAVDLAEARTVSEALAHWLSLEASGRSCAEARTVIER